MKKIYFLLSVILFISYSASAQSHTLQWQKSFGGSASDFAESVEQTNDSGFITAGISYSADGDVTASYGGGDYWIIKTASSGVMQWQKTFGGSNYDLATSIHQTFDSGYIVAGVSLSNDGDITDNHGSYDFWIVKLKSDGSIDWKKSLGGSGWDDGEAIQQTTDSGYIVAGYTNSVDGDVTGNHGGFDYLVIKLDKAGNIQWQKCYGGTGNDYAFSILQSTSGGYIVAGYTNSVDGDVTGNHGGADYWVAKIDVNGALQWQKSLGGTDDDYAYAVTQDNNGNYVVAGRSSSSIYGNHGGRDYYIVMLNSAGTTQWQYCYGGSGDDDAYSIAACKEGGYLVGGYSNSNDGNATLNHGNSDEWILRLSSTGTMLWQKSFGGSNTDGARCVKQTLEGGYILFGSSSSNDGDLTLNHGADDYWLVKLSTDYFISINNKTVIEGNSGTTAMKFKVTLSTPSSSQVKVNYTTADSTAKAPGDYTATSGTLKFNAGQTSKTITVLVNGDTQKEKNEKLKVLLSQPVNAILLDSIGIGTIKNDDAALLNAYLLESDNSNVNTSSFNIALSPNPAKSNAVLHISGKQQNVSVTITDIYGKMLWQLQPVTNETINLPIENFAGVMYIVSVSNGKEIKTLKLVKE